MRDESELVAWLEVPKHQRDWWMVEAISDGHCHVDSIYDWLAAEGIIATRRQLGEHLMGMAAADDLLYTEDGYQLGDELAEAWAA